MMERETCILAVDDEQRLLSAIKRILETAGYQVLTAHDGAEALAKLRSQPVDLILTDIRMPRMNGYQLHQRVVENPQWVTIPFIFLTARELDSEVRYGKELGADDYLIKPVRSADLLAAVRGRLRRARQLAGSSVMSQARPIEASKALDLGQLRIDPAQHRVWMDGQPVKLSAREFRLLERLARQPNQVVASQELIQATHDLHTDAVDAGALLRPLIRSLRRKLGYGAGDMGCIKNVRGVGYQLLPPLGP